MIRAQSMLSRSAMRALRTQTVSRTASTRRHLHTSACLRNGCPAGSSALVQNNELFTANAEKLKALGLTPAQHAMVQTSADNKDTLEKCPYLAQFPQALRTAQRESNARSYNRRFPISVAHAKGLTLTDTNGNKYLDMLGCAGTLALGHNHPVVNQAITDFLASEAPGQMLDITTPLKDEFVTQLFKAVPAEFAKTAKVQFCGPAGTDCVEAALKIAKHATGRQNIIAFHGGYHGHTNGALSLMGNLSAKGTGVNLMPGVHFMPYPFAYRCPFGLGESGTKVASAYLENVLKDVESGIVKPAAIILECVQGEGGVIQAPPEFLREVRRICTEHDIVMICDEIQSGFGRTGKMLAFEHAGIIPDIVTMSKAVGGSLPMAVAMYDIKLDSWGPGSHAGTFRGNQMSMATGAATLKYIMENDLAGTSATKGAKLTGLLNDIKGRTSTIGDVRGPGLMIGVELVDPRGTPSAVGSLPAWGELAALVQSNAFERGMIIERGGRHGAVIRFLPPLIVTEAELDQGAEIFEASLVAAEKAMGVSK